VVHLTGVLAHMGWGPDVGRSTMAPTNMIGTS
jgi:hypothetical protein